MLRRFITLFTARSGSTLLMDMLHRHPWVTALGEELGKSRGLAPDQQREWLERFYAHPHRLRAAVGFKSKLWYLADRDHLRTTLQRHGVRVVHLTRSNTLRAAVSAIRSHERHAALGTWNARRGDPPLEPSTINLTELDRQLGIAESTRAELAAFVGTLGTPVADVAYEELLQDRRSVLKRLARFLRTPLLDRLADRTRIRKNTPAEWHRAVVNLDELRSHLAGTPYEGMLEQP